MATTNGETLTELERRAETTRAELAQTVDALHNRISPGAIKSDMRSYARERSQTMMQAVEDRVRENPLQAMAIAVGIAYPFLKLAGRLPLPLLMIGAGVALSRQQGAGSGMSRGNGGRGGYGSSHGYASQGGSAMSLSGQEEEGQGGPGMMASVKEKAADLGSQMTEKAHQTMESLRAYAAGAGERTSGLLSDTYEGSRRRAAGAAHQLGQGYERTRDNLTVMAERYPLAAGGIAFAVGTMLAAALPVTRRENRLMGETADAFRQRTGAMARQGMAQARTAARDISRLAASDVREQGLTPEVARHSARSAMASAREAVQPTVAGDSAGPQGRNGHSSTP